MPSPSPITEFHLHRPDARASAVTVPCDGRIADVPARTRQYIVSLFVFSVLLAQGLASFLFAGVEGVKGGGV
jgi:hypothetical protein